jgi:serine/threonine protein kinase
MASNFSAIVQNPRLAFRDSSLQACEIERNALHQPRVWSGAFAVVYKGTDPQGKAWALRAFTSESGERREHYDRISEYLKARKLACLVDFEYREGAIRSAADGKWYPLVVMDWVEGSTLFAWVGAKCRQGKGASLAKAVRHWLALVDELVQARIAHGDLQHANVLVTPEGRLKLVDYDGMCVPGLVGRRNLEIGVQPYQHPQRNESTLLSSELDHFSALVIYVALRALAADTTLWARHVEQANYDKLLFRTTDFQDRGQSGLCRDLLASPDPGVRELAEQLFSYASGTLDETPALRDLVGAEAAGVPATPVAVPRVPWGAAAPEPARTPDRPAARVVLEVVAGPIQGSTFVLDRHDTLLVGRGADCRVRIAGDTRVSRHHFLLEAVPPHVRLRDLGSRNGTFVNGVRCGGRSAGDPAAAAAEPSPEVDVKHGDQIAAGRTLIHVRVEGIPVQPAADTPPLPAGPPAVPIGPPERLIERLEIGREIGSGPLGTVYEAVHKDLPQRVAVKIVQPKAAIGSAERQRLLEEVTVVQKLQHPHIVGLLELGLLRRAFYFVSDYCDGGSLDQWLQRDGKLILGQVRPLLLQSLDALNYAHQQGILHGDLKPQNMLLHHQEKKLIVRLNDFGLARALEKTGGSGMTVSSRLDIHYRFLPRERVTGFRDFVPASDLWSLAAVFYYALTGQAPTQFSGRDPIAAILQAQPVPIRERDRNVPLPVAQVFDRALHVDVTKRHRTAAEMKSQFLWAFDQVRGD